MDGPEPFSQTRIIREFVSNDPTGDRRFQRLIDAISDYAIYMIDPEGIVSSWNTGAHRSFGYTADEIIGSQFTRFYTEDDRASGLPERSLRETAEKGRFEIEGWHVRKDGSKFRASILIDPIRAENGDLVGFATVTRDITERKRAETALAASERNFRLLVQGVTDYAIYLLDTQGYVSNWNAGAQRFKGYTADEIIGKHFSLFYTDPDRESGLPQRALETARREGRFEAEGWRRRKDGTHFWASVVIDPIRDDDGNLIGFAKVTRDITEKRKQQEALEQTRAALFQAQKMESIGQLTGGIAHDLNNLLTVIANGLDLISRNLRDPRDIRRLEAAQRATERGAKLTQQLLAFARRQPLRPERLNPSALIREFEPVLRRACSEVIDLEFDLQARVQQCNIDGPQFESAILNLVVNARDAMPQGGRLLIRTAGVTLDPQRRSTLGPGNGTGECVMVSVEDSGMGMPPEVQARAFDPFFTTKEVGKGTGLGLSQVYGFVTQSGGLVEIDSKPGEGTAVRIFLPVVEMVQEAEGESGQHGRDAGTVLIVEDEPEVLDIAVEIFETLGYNVSTAPDAISALGKLKKGEHADVLFSDVVMPKGMNGIELAREARQLRPDLKILLASGYPLPALSAEFGALDEFAFLSKPYRWTELAERLKGLRADSPAS